jgi:indolepyruvate ferredoxin oxidoreductase beta subunit
MKNMSKNIKLVGVGGQGTILSTKILTQALLNAGYDVKMSEIHGMSQRGGSVSSDIRFGKNVASPVVVKGTADFLVAFEQMEAVRYLSYLKEDGILIVNDLKINSMLTQAGKIKYPEDIIKYLKERNHTYVFDATKKAVELGNSKVLNIILLGVLVKAMGLEELPIVKAIEDLVKPQFIEINKKAYKLGLSMIT